jgi:acyl-CoA hydrolase/GNAT superfamily N-acetyltransferase
MLKNFFSQKKQNDEQLFDMVDVQLVISQIQPGTKLYLGSGISEPLDFIDALLQSNHTGLIDVEIFQLTIKNPKLVAMACREPFKFRLKTIFRNAVIDPLIFQGDADFIPCRLTKLLSLVESKLLVFDMAIVRTCVPDVKKHCNLSAVVDINRTIIKTARFKAAEIHQKLPMVYGDTHIPCSFFNALYVGNTPLAVDVMPEPTEDDFAVAKNIAELIDSNACISFLADPLFTALSKELMGRKGLSIHSPIFIPACMELIDTNVIDEKAVVSYAMADKNLLEWLHLNPMVEFQSIDKVLNSSEIAKKPKFCNIVPIEKIDFNGRVVLKPLKILNMAELLEIFTGTELSNGGLTIFAINSRDNNLSSNFTEALSGEHFGNHFMVDYVASEYGLAFLKGKTTRERVQALIDIAHPDDRKKLLARAKASGLVYKDQILVNDNVALYPSSLSTVKLFGDLMVKFRALKPSDEEGVRRLIYNISPEGRALRYFQATPSMPHRRVQEYVNVDYNKTVSVVGITIIDNHEIIIAEARFISRINLVRDQAQYKGQYDKRFPTADSAYMVDDRYQRQGVGKFLVHYLCQIAINYRLKCLEADYHTTNPFMRRVFDTLPYQVTYTPDGNTFHVNIKLS